MNTRLLTIIFVIFAVLLSACGATATPEMIAVAPQAESEPAVEEKVQTELIVVEQPVEVVVEEEVVVQATRPALIDNQPQPLTNTFKDYGNNPYIDTIEDHLSTFGLDVDTASYTVARRYVYDGMLPPADAVRVEEFINYFDPGYSAPYDVAFGIFADGAPSPFHTPGTYILRFGIQGYEVSEADRKPANLTFVIDVSGSMDLEYRLGLVKQSLELLVERLRPNDSVGIVVYGSEARTVLYPTSAEDRQAILDAIYSLEPEGSTNAEAGLRMGYDMAYRAFHPDAINRVILCSDGVANVGATGPDAILEFDPRLCR